MLKNRFLRSQLPTVDHIVHSWNKSSKAEYSVNKSIKLHMDDILSIVMLSIGLFMRIRDRLLFHIKFKAAASILGSDIFKRLAIFKGSDLPHP